MYFAGLLCAFVLQASAASLHKIADNIIRICTETESDPAWIAACEKLSDKGFENGCDVRELFLKVPMDNHELDSLSGAQRSDGSWPDINYDDTRTGSWSPSLHAFRVYRLSVRHLQDKNGRALDAALKAMNFWLTSSPSNSNWWHNDIGIPRLMGPAFIMLRDQMNPRMLEKAAAMMSSSTGIDIDETGQNKVWLSGRNLMMAILTGDDGLASRSRDSLLSSLDFAPEGDGVKQDYSFHQHGPQLQNGNYGLSYAVSLSWWARVLQGTGLDFPPRQIRFLKEYVQYGIAPLIWVDRFDPNACARQVFPNAQAGKALCARYAAQNIGIRSEELHRAHFFPFSDFGYFRGDGWYASIRMQSSRTVGFENTNRENMKGYFSSDGALLLRVSGDEYDDIWPVWNGHHIPGVTSWDDGGEIWGKRNGNGETAVWPYNKSDRVSGIVQDGYMIAAMDYDRDSLTCRKAWFFFEGGIICLGAGITRPGKETVTTTIEQNLLLGRIRKKRDGALHRGIAYLLLEKADCRVSASVHEGKWSWMSPALSGETVEVPVFEMVIHHGAGPVDASYAYAEIPGKSFRHARKAMRRVTLLENTKHRQSVRIDGKDLTVQWEPFSLSIR